MCSIVVSHKMFDLQILPFSPLRPKLIETHEHINFQVVETVTGVVSEPEAANTQTSTSSTGSTTASSGTSVLAVSNPVASVKTPAGKVVAVAATGVTPDPTLSAGEKKLVSLLVVM